LRPVFKKILQPCGLQRLKNAAKSANSDFLQHFAAKITESKYQKAMHLLRKHRFYKGFQLLSKNTL